MLLAHVNNPNSYKVLFQTNPVWQKALDWAKDKGNHILPPGEYPISDAKRSIYAIVERKNTQPYDLGRHGLAFHRLYVDLHFCLEYGEVIYWQTYNPEDALILKQCDVPDSTLFACGDIRWTASEIIMNPGTFAIFFPGDAHMTWITHPQLMQKSQLLTKIVIKIHRSHFDGLLY